MSAAAGKIGAIIAQVLIGPLRTRGATPNNASPWLNHVMQIYALFMLLGTFTSLLIPETKRKTLEQLAGEVPGTPEYDPSHGVHHTMPGKNSHEGGEESYEKGEAV